MVTSPTLNIEELTTQLSSFFEAIRVINSETSFQYVKGLLDGNAKLADERKMLENTWQVNVAQIKKLSQQLEDAEARVREKEDELMESRQHTDELEERVRGAEKEA